MCVFSHLVGIMVTELHFGNGITITELCTWIYIAAYQLIQATDIQVFLFPLTVRLFSCFC